MRKVLIVILLLLISISGVSCKGKPDGSDEPVYEKIYAEATDVPAEFSEDSSSVPGLDDLEEGVRVYPDDPNARFVYMNALKRAGRVEEALDQAWMLAEMGGADNPFKSVAYLNFAQMILNLIPEDADNRAGLVQQAIDGLWIALGWEPESIPAHLALGRLALESADTDKALHHLAIALTVTEIGYDLRIKMAEIYFQRGDLGKAEAHLSTAMLLAEEAEDEDALDMIEDLIELIEEAGSE